MYIHIKVLKKEINTKRLIINITIIIYAAHARRKMLFNTAQM